MGSPDKAQAWDKKLLTMLDYLATNPVANMAGVDTLNVLFDENLVCTDEPTLRKMSDEQRDFNTRRTAALKLFGCDESLTSVTRLDLAIITSNKAFMGHSTTAAFLNRTWQLKRGNGTWVDSWIPAAPVTRWRISTCGYIGFMILYGYVYLRLPWAGHMKSPTRIEWTFWIVVGGQLAGEFSQWKSSFTSFREYAIASGNGFDMFASMVFLLSFVLRMVSMAIDWKEGYVVVYILLTLNLFACHTRLLKCFSAYKRVGEIQIIVGKIFVNDIAVVVPYLLLVTICFETSAFFFSWILEVPSFRYAPVAHVPTQALHGGSNRSAAASCSLGSAHDL